MSTRLSRILAYADEIEYRSQLLVNKTQESNLIINRISSLFDRALHCDEEIDDITELIKSNSQAMNDFNNLYEKSFYLQNNIHTNDPLTNQTSFEHLTKEFSYLLEKLIPNDDYAYIHQEPINFTGVDEIDLQSDDEGELIEETYEADEVESQTTLRPPDIKKMISISNLKLKPMRCTSSDTKIAKKKSRYRLSAIYNINPIAYEESTIVSSTMSELSMPTSTSRITSGGGDIYSLDTAESVNVMHNQDHHHHAIDDLDEIETIASTPPSVLGPPFKSRIRSNSLPTTSTGNKSSSETDIFQELNREDDILRYNRLKHFISINDFHPRHGEHHPEQHHPEPHSDLLFDDVYGSSPTPRRRVQHELDYDMASVCSDLSYYSPEKQEDDERVEDEFDNFNRFLRASRTELNKPIHEAFPHLVRKSSGEGYRTEEEEIAMPTPRVKSVLRFHNPIDGIHLGTSHIASPTIGKVQVQQQTNSSTKEDPKKILNDVISASVPATRIGDNYSPPLPAPSPPSSPRSTSFLSSLSNYSPTKITFRSQYQSNTSITPKSLTDSFLDLVKKPTKSNKPPTPEKLKELRRKQKQRRNSNIPISIKSDSQLKRMPSSVAAARNDGAFSRLTIGPNNTRIVNHGEASVFRKPIVRSYNEGALREALAASLLD
ncbi:uncharacterized protein J8A68_001127 [[Candida] subhashii]|uniref:Uncharacterized protein n=1 Tax=[Candida] subhashii TaxID=561895 RepID=A0A8J5QQ61_9ASCO|nr:uncharacterized protein J8A68_001127 [[Candida] subhashii]KAG7665439.1 hypothetical protein J8A68_001127 [[Candida] subhashii]